MLQRKKDEISNPNNQQVKLHTYTYTHLEMALEMVESKPLHSHNPHDGLRRCLCNMQEQHNIKKQLMV
jgi:hypothetical protein